MELLYKEFYKKLYLYALTYLDDEDEAKDVISDVFSSIWQKWQNEDAIDPKPSFLFITVRNRCLDKLRHTKAKERYELMIAATDFIENDDDVKDYEQKIADIRAAVEKLQEPGKTILKCCYFKRLSYKETSEELNISITMVHKHMLKVFKTLREMLK